MIFENNQNARQIFRLKKGQRMVWLPVSLNLPVLGNTFAQTPKLDREDYFH